MTHYAILGGGRLARHFGHYFSLLSQRYTGWARDRSSPLNTHADPDNRQRLLKTIAPASHVLLLVSDDAIASLVRQYPFLHRKTLIQCAGALSLPGIAGAHPLMTFANELYSLAQYRRIPFMVESGYRFKELFPALPNPQHVICVEKKALYHALCVMAGNFPQILWQAISETFEAQLALNPDVLHPYLRQLTKNFCDTPDSALTGPLSRGDVDTVNRNLQALSGEELLTIYTSFVRFYERSSTAGILKEQAS